VRFEITAGPDAGKEIEPAGDRYVVGREDVDFLLGDDEVSRQHFELRTLPDGRIEISDLGSRNGTRVNGERLTGPRTLEGGEEISVGVTTILVEAPPPPDPGATKVSASPPPDPNETAAAAEVPPGLRADEPAPGGPDDATAPQPVAPPPPGPATPPPSEPVTPPPPSAPEPPTPPPPPAPGPPAPPPRPRGAAPPAPGTPPPPGRQASQGSRTTALVLSILGVLGGVFALIVVGVALSLDLCSGEDLSFFEDCYDGSSGTRAIGSILSVLGAIASVAFLVFSIRYFTKSRSPQLVLATGIATVLLIGIGLAVI
jgi:hypothetical protein